MVEMTVPVINLFGEPVKESVKSVFSGINTAVEALDLFGRFRNAHFLVTNDVVGKVKVLGMGSPIPIGDFYYPARVTKDIQRRFYVDEWVSQNDSSSRRLGGAEKYVDGSMYVEASQRLVVLGGAGAGKTTFLKFLAYAYLNVQIFNSTKLKTSKLPFYVYLPDLSKDDGCVIDFVTKQLVAREGSYAIEYVKRACKIGASVFLFDSLDEVSVSERGALVEKIKIFCTTYPSVKCVLSCRAADYNQALDGFDEVELAKLSKVAVTKIVNSWFLKDRLAARRLLSVIENDPGFSSLTETPLLLCLLCIQFRHDLQLPRRKVEVYRRCMEALLRDWDAGRGFRRESEYATLTDGAKERML